LPTKSKSQLLTENAVLWGRLGELEVKLARLPTNGSAPPEGGSVTGQTISDALQASEMRYRRLFETAKDGILLLDANTGEIADVNPFLQDLLGYARSELLGKALWELGPFRDIVASQAAFRQLQSQEYIRYENLPLETKDGQRKQVEFVSNVYLVEGRKVIQCNVRDITARKQAEEDVRQANAELLTLVAELQKRDREMQLLNRMNDLLQACTTQAEAYQVVSLVAGELFAGQSGCLAILHTWDQYLETVARWGDTAQMEPVFALEDCWAMRRGLPHAVVEPSAGLLCRHFVQPPESGYLCVPLLVQGDTLGVLCLLDLPQGDVIPATLQQLAVTVGEAIKLSLSNLKLREKLREQAVHDPLTGLFNRRHLEDGLVRELHRAQRGNSALCLVMLDLDHFKQFNDSFGHNAGDALLRGLAQLLREHLRDSDIVCRYGGEEFVLVLPDSSLQDTLDRMEQIRVLVKELQPKHGDQVLGPVSISAGVVEARQYNFESSEILRAADEAMYAAKRAGRDRVVVDPGARLKDSKSDRGMVARLAPPWPGIVDEE
jgi:diguanylate cyclase (GGDEF)-like protein/PAS domain S-box-containing protein